MLRRDYLSRLRSEHSEVVLTAVSGETVKINESVFKYYSTVPGPPGGTPFSMTTLQAFREVSDYVLLSDSGTKPGYQQVLRALEVAVFLKFDTVFTDDLLKLLSDVRERAYTVISLVLWSATRYSESLLETLISPGLVRVLWSELLVPCKSTEIPMKEFRVRLLNDTWFRKLVTSTDSGRILLPIHNKFLVHRGIVMTIKHSVREASEILAALDGILTRELCSGSDCMYRVEEILTHDSEFESERFVIQRGVLRTNSYLHRDYTVEFVSQQCKVVATKNFDDTKKIQIPKDAVHIVIRS